MPVPAPSRLNKICLKRKGVRSNMAKEFKLSPERWKALKDELVYLKTVREKEVADQIKEARSFGDLSENSEYDEAKNEENILENCVVIEEDNHDGKTVRLGSQIKVLNIKLNQELEYEVVGSQEADPMNGRISEDSPFGRALLGKSVGDDVVVEAPAGTMHYKVLEISK